MKKFSMIALFLVMGLGCGTNVTTDIDSEDVVMEEVILDNLIPEDIINDDEGVISDSMDVQNDIEDVNDTKDTNVPPEDTNTTDEVCTPVCEANTCIDDGCGTPCACDVGSTCTDSACVPDVCVPNCEGKKCGPDGCDGTCGTCDDGNPCTDDSCNEGSCEFIANDVNTCSTGIPCSTATCVNGTCEVVTKFINKHNENKDMICDSTTTQGWLVQGCVFDSCEIVYKDDKPVIKIVFGDSCGLGSSPRCLYLLTDVDDTIKCEFIEINSTNCPSE